MTAADLIARADEIDGRLGPIPGHVADAIANQLREAARLIQAALQRLNESGTGEMGLLETIHATHDILRGVAAPKGQLDLSGRYFSALMELLADIDDVADGKLPEISAATLTRARQAVEH